MKKTKRRWHIEVDLIDHSVRFGEFMTKGTIREELISGMVCLEGTEPFTDGDMKFRKLRITEIK